jgi:hypothetical protein
MGRQYCFSGTFQEIIAFLDTLQGAPSLFWNAEQGADVRSIAAYFNS